MKAMIFSTSKSQFAELVGCANALPADDISAIVLGHSEDADFAAAYVDSVMFVELAEGTTPEAYAAGIAAAACDKGFDAFLCGSTTIDRTIAGHVAHAAGVAAVPAVKDLTLSEGRLSAMRVVFGGGAVRKESCTKGVFCAAPGICKPAEQCVSGSIHPLAVAMSGGLSLVGEVAKEAKDNNVVTASRVVGIGRGFSSSEDVELAKELAAALDGAVGYTRPLTETDPPLAEGEPYIGVSGLQISPDLYIAVGISGQTQHVVGVNDSKVVVCINSDANALMFRYSDYGIVADFHEAIPALVSAVGK